MRWPWRNRFTKTRRPSVACARPQGLETVSRLAGGVAHDFNNFLTGVLLYCDLLVAGLEPGHRARKYAEEIRSAGMQAAGLVRQLLAVSRPSNCEPRLLSLNEIADGMRSLLVRLIGENIELKFRLGPNLGLIRMDHTQAQQVLLNVVLNARDAMPVVARSRSTPATARFRFWLTPGPVAPHPFGAPSLSWGITAAAWMPPRKFTCSKLSSPPRAARVQDWGWPRCMTSSPETGA